MNKYEVPAEVTDQDIIEYGFTNYHKPVFYFMRMLDSKVSINISIMKKSRKVKVETLFEEVLQPADISRNKELTDKVDSILSDMVEKGLLNKVK